MRGAVVGVGCGGGGQRKTNTRELCLPSFLALQGEADWRNMLAVVSKPASWIWTVGKPQSDKKQAAWPLPMFEFGPGVDLSAARSVQSNV